MIIVPHILFIYFFAYVGKFIFNLVLELQYCLACVYCILH